VRDLLTMKLAKKFLIPGNASVDDFNIICNRVKGTFIEQESLRPQKTRKERTDLETTWQLINGKSMT
jgi:hypothetical protein